MITKYQAMLAAMPARIVSNKIKAVEDMLNTLRGTLAMLEEADMLTHTEFVSLAKPLFELEDQVYNLLCVVNEVEDVLVTYSQGYDFRMAWINAPRPDIEEVRQWYTANETLINGGKK